MFNLTGEYQCKLDAKGRFMIPAGIRKQLPDKLVIKKGFEGYIDLYPEEIWNQELQKINELNMFVKENRLFRNYFMRGVTQVETDAIGRILITKPLLEHCQMSNDIVIVGRGTQLEIWDKSNYENSFDALDAEDFSLLAEKVMGNKKGALDA